AEDGIRDRTVTGVQTCALPILRPSPRSGRGNSLIRDILSSPPERPVDAVEDPVQVGEEVLFQLGGRVRRVEAGDPDDRGFERVEIGRASCRERGWVGGVEGGKE